MNKKNIAVITGCLVVSALAGVGTIKAQNRTDKLSVYIPNAGIALALDNYNIENDAKKAELSALITHTVAAANTEEDTMPATETTTEPVTETETIPEETTTPESVQTSIYDSIAMSQVDNYVNVRSLPSTDGEIVGKIYNNCAANIVGTEGEWYNIVSGNVSGYVKSEYFVTGEEAKAVAIQCGYVNATVTTETLNVRDGQGTDNKLLTQLPEGGVFDVIQYGDGWVYLNVDEDIQGWVSMDYVDIDVKFDTAITLEEEQAKLEEERRRAEEAAEAERIANEAKKAEEQRKQQAEQQKKQQQPTQSQPAQTKPTVNETYDTSTSSAIRNAVVTYALQFVGNPYVYGGSSLTNGTDCSGFTMSVYAKFGYSLPHQSASQSGCGTRVSLDSLLPGDLLFYSNGGSGIGHVALYIGNGQVVHASTPSTGIKISNANYRTPVCAVRIVE